MPTCSNPKCRVAQTGVCLDGHPSGCPNLIADKEGPEVAEIKPEPTPAPEPRRFHTGEKLQAHEASRFLNQYAAHVILCVGSQESGKTTFLARLGEMFRDGSFSKHKFVRSMTLNGFERLTWHATIPSGSARPVTKRTYRTENDKFLHLSICPREDPGERTEILVSDLAGETFTAAVASKETCDASLALRRADHLVLFLDCEKLADQDRRHAERSNAKDFLQRVVGAKTNPKALHVEVIFSRHDKVASHKDPAEMERSLDSIQEELSNKYSGNFASMKFWRVAAS